MFINLNKMILKVFIKIINQLNAIQVLENKHKYYG